MTDGRPFFARPKLRHWDVRFAEPHSLGLWNLLETGWEPFAGLDGQVMMRKRVWLSGRPLGLHDELAVLTGPEQLRPLKGENRDEGRAGDA